MPRKLFWTAMAASPSRSWSCATRCAGDALRTPTTRPMAMASLLASFRLRNMVGIALFRLSGCLSCGLTIFTFFGQIERARTKCTLSTRRDDTIRYRRHFSRVKVASGCKTLASTVIEATPIAQRPARCFVCNHDTVTAPELPLYACDSKPLLNCTTDKHSAAKQDALRPAPHLRGLAR